nr:hypothetical protein CFP56_53342 [Quercus suber]
MKIDNMIVFNRSSGHCSIFVCRVAATDVVSKEGRSGVLDLEVGEILCPVMISESKAKVETADLCSHEDLVVAANLES